LAMKGTAAIVGAFPLPIDRRHGCGCACGIRREMSLEWRHIVRVKTGKEPFGRVAISRQQTCNIRLMVDTRVTSEHHHNPQGIWICCRDMRVRPRES
jgi:hypothetical protein